MSIQVPKSSKYHKVKRIQEADFLQYFNQTLYKLDQLDTCGGPPRSHRYPTWYSPPFYGCVEVSGERSRLQTKAKKHEKSSYFNIFLALFLYHDSLRFPGPHLDQCARNLLIINNTHFLHRQVILALETENILSSHVRNSKSRRHCGM